MVARHESQSVWHCLWADDSVILFSVLNGHLIWESMHMYPATISSSDQIETGIIGILGSLGLLGLLVLCGFLLVLAVCGFLMPFFIWRIAVHSKRTAARIEYIKQTLMSIENIARRMERHAQNSAG